MKVLSEFFAITLLGLWSAYVLLCLWRWFVVPLGAPEITYWHAFGLGLFLTMAALFTKTYVADEERDQLWLIMVTKFILYGIVWLHGAAIDRWAMP